MLSLEFRLVNQYHFSIFLMCSCSNVAAVSALVCLTSTVVSSANVSILLLVVVGMLAMYNVYYIGPETLPCGGPALTSFTSECTSFIFTTKVLLLRCDLNKWWICSGKCVLIVCKRFPRFTLSNAFSMSLKRAAHCT